MSSLSPAEESYRAPVGGATAELTERGSRFRAELVPVADEAAAGRALEEIEHRLAGATHHCWARRVGWPPEERSADAGEPAGTAGEPILRVLAGAGVSDVLLVVTRWYGGVKLGKGGLARAYSGAAAACLAGASLRERRPTVVYELAVPYDRTGAVERLLAGPGLEAVGRRFAEKLEIEIEAEVAVATALERAVAELGADVEMRRIRDGRSP